MNKNSRRSFFGSIASAAAIPVIPAISGTVSQPIAVNTNRVATITVPKWLSKTLQTGKALPFLPDLILVSVYEGGITDYIDGCVQLIVTGPKCPRRPPQCIPYSYGRYDGSAESLDNLTWNFTQVTNL